MEVSSQELGNEVAVANEYGSFYISVQPRCESDTYISSRGEMKMSLKLIICGGRVSTQPARHSGPNERGGVTRSAHVLVAEML